MAIAYRYCTRLMFRYLLLVLVFLFGLALLIELSGEIPLLGTHRYDIWIMLLCSLLRLPVDIYDFIPIGGMLGVIIALTILTKRHELVVLRACGLSLRRLNGWLLLNGTLLIALLVAFGEYCVPYCAQLSRQLKTAALSSGRVKVAQHGALWISQAPLSTNTAGSSANKDDIREIIYIGQIINNRLYHLVYYRFNIQRHQLLQVSRAQIATPSGPNWRLQGVRTTYFHDQAASAQQLSTLSSLDARPTLTTRDQQELLIPLKFSIELLTSAKVDTSEQNLVQLNQSIAQHKAHDLNTRPQEIAWWLRVYHPFSALLMIMLALPLVLSISNQRHDGSIKLLLGLLLSFMFYTLHQLISLFGILTLIDLRLVAALPTLCLLIVYLGWSLGSR